MKKYLFVVNPNAGKKASRQLMQLVTEKLPRTLSHEIIIWEDKNNFESITNYIRNGDHSHIIAVGGDGTVNSVAASLVNTTKILGIIPSGSGNGLARSMGMSMDSAKAIEEITIGKTVKIDCGNVNGQYFFCTSGVGFDALIGNRFANSRRRGLWSYVKITTSELFKYRAQEYEIAIDNQHIKRKAFLVTVANAGQYGNDFYIAPLAKLSDGYLNVAILKPFTIFSVGGILFKILKRQAHMSSKIESYRAKTITIKRAQPDNIHFDGEPKFETPELDYSVHASALTVITGKAYKKEVSIEF